MPKRHRGLSSTDEASVASSSSAEVDVSRHQPTLTTSQMLQQTRPIQTKSPIVIPSNRVGSVELYTRFAQEYDALMSRHQCGELRTILHKYLDRIVASASPSTRCYNHQKDETKEATQSPSHEDERNSVAVVEAAPVRGWLHVGDFGGGTGRISSMLARRPEVRFLCSYDKEKAMLKVAHYNVTEEATRESRSAATTTAADLGSSPSSQDVPRSIRVLDTAEELPPLLLDELRGEEDGSSSSAPSPPPLYVCFRPYSFEQIQQGVLSGAPAQPQKEEEMPVACKTDPETREKGSSSSLPGAHPKFQMIVCAWSLSFVMRAQWGGDRWHHAVSTTIRSMLAALDTTLSDAVLVIVETLGNGCTEPTRHNTLMTYLEEQFGFERVWIRTDYIFASSEEAFQMCRFFFAKGVAEKLQESQATALPECTGVWCLWLKKGESLQSRFP